MSPDGGETESEIPNTSNYPFYEDVPDYEYNKKRFDYLDAEELMEQTDAFMKKIVSIYEKAGKVDSIFFLDKSARPLAYMFRHLFREYVRDETIKQPQILFLNVGQEITLPDPSQDITKEVGFSGDAESVRKVFGKWIKPNSNVLVVDEYSSTGRSLNRATDIVKDAFSSENVSIQSLAAYTKVPKWYNRPDYLGVSDRTVEDYIDYSRKEADKELGTSYSHIKPDDYGRLSTRDVPMEVQLKRLEIQNRTLHESVGDIPSAKKRLDSKINIAREELLRMCTQIVTEHSFKFTEVKTTDKLTA